MSVLRYVIVTSTGGALSAALLFACATSVDIGQQELPSEDAGTAQAIPDADLPGEDAPADAPPDDVVTSACSPDGFCFEPVPIQMALAAVSGSSMDDVWAAAGKHLLRYRGTQWELAYEYARATPPSITFSRIWATTPDNVWATASDDTGYLVIVRYAALDGGAPSFREIATTTPAATSVWITPSSDAAWVTTSRSNAIVRYREDGDGRFAVDTFVPKTSTASAPTYWVAVWGFGPDDVYALGQDFRSNAPTSPPLLAHYDGTAWTITPLALPVQALADGLSGTPPTGERRLWVSSTQQGVSSVTLYPIEDGAIGDALVDEKVTAQLPCGSKVASTVSATAAWMSSGTVVCRWDGAQLSPVSTALGGLPSGVVRGIWAANEDDVWLVGEAVPQGPDFPTTAFAARRMKDAGGAQP